LEVPLIFLRESGARMFRGDDALVVRGGRCYPVDLATGPYPGINSDMQPLFAVYGAAASGESRLIDLRFPGRYAYADELAQLGVQHRTEGNVLRIVGGAPLTGADVRAIDLRAGIALCLAGLMADGVTTVLDAWQVERGYSNFAPKLTALGGRIDAG
jgi:UDP-N-acetylglucosamine 1-carboxyvinyltransferase